MVEKGLMIEHFLYVPLMTLSALGLNPNLPRQVKFIPFYYHSRYWAKHFELFVIFLNLSFCIIRYWIGLSFSQILFVLVLKIDVISDQSPGWREVQKPGGKSSLIVVK